MPYIGEIQLFAGDYAPVNWAFCDGSLIQIKTNQALYSLIGVQFGGDGKTTFALPDFRSRLAVGTGQGPTLTNRKAGDKGGTEGVALTVDQIPQHTHGVSAELGVAVMAASQRGDTSVPTATSMLAAGYDIQMNEDCNSFAPGGSTPQVPLGGTYLTTNPQVGTAGQSAQHNNLMPWIALNYIIATQGIYPARP